MAKQGFSPSLSPLPAPVKAAATQTDFLDINAKGFMPAGYFLPVLQTAGPEKLKPPASTDGAAWP